MKTKREVAPRQQLETQPAEAAETSELHSPRKMTFAENVVLTIKVLTGFGVLGALLWAINLWKTAE